MHTPEAPYFWGLQKNKNCVFPLKLETFAQAQLFVITYFS